MRMGYARHGSASRSTRLGVGGQQVTHKGSGRHTRNVARAVWDGHCRLFSDHMEQDGTQQGRMAARGRLPGGGDFKSQG